MTGSYKRFDQINPSLFDRLIRTSREGDQPEGTDFVPMGLMSPDTSTRQPSISPVEGEVSTSDNILTRSAAAMGAFSTDPDLVASTVVPQPRIPEEVDLSEWESMTPIGDIVGTSQTEQAIPTLPSSGVVSAPMLPQITANEYVPVHEAIPSFSLPSQPSGRVEAPEMVVLSPEEIERYTARTVPKNGRYPTHRELGETEGIVIHYTHSGGRQGASLQAYYDNGIAQGIGAPIHIARDGTITIVGDWRNANIQHAAPSRGRGLLRSLSGAEYNTLNTIGIEMEVGWNYNSGVPGGSQWDGPDGESTPEQDAALARLIPYLISEINAERPEDSQLSVDRDVLAHIEIGRKQEVEGRRALGNLRESLGLPRERDVTYYVDSSTGRENVLINRSLVPQPRPTSENSSKQTTEKGEAGKQTTAKDEQPINDTWGDRVIKFENGQPSVVVDELKQYASETFSDPISQAAFIATMEAETGDGETLIETGWGGNTPQEIMAEFGYEGNNESHMVARRAALRNLFASDDWKNANPATRGNMVFDIVYDDQYRGEGYKLGNTQPGDGSRYRGRGLIQISGRANYRELGQAIGVDLEENPDLLITDPNVMLMATQEYLRNRNFSTRATDAASLASIVGHADDDNKTEATARWNRALEIYKEITGQDYQGKTDSDPETSLVPRPRPNTQE